MDLWDYREFREPERFSEEEETLLSALERKDEAEAGGLLDVFAQPISDPCAHIALRMALDCPAELFRRVLDQCPPGEYSELYAWREEGHETTIRARGSFLLLAAAKNRPRQVRVLLERGYDCNGAGIGLDWRLQASRTINGDAVPAYAQYCAACGNRLDVDHGKDTWSVPCATPLTAALLCGSLDAARVLLDWPGVWRAESSVVCRAAVLVLEKAAAGLFSLEQQAAQREILQRIFCPDRAELPEREAFFRTFHLHPASFVDICTAHTLRCQLEGGRCTEEEARQMLELLGKEDKAQPLDSARAEKLLLLKQFFPKVCRQPWTAGVFLREALRRIVEGRPHQRMLRAWMELCGEERDLTWAGERLWEMDRKTLRQFLEEAGHGGALVMDGDAVRPGAAGDHSDCLVELLNSVHFRPRAGEGVSGLMQELLGASNLRLLRLAAKRGVFSGEDPTALLEHLKQQPETAPGARTVILAYAGRTCGEAVQAPWQEPHRWAWWDARFRVSEEACRKTLETLLHRELAEEDYFQQLFQICCYQKQQTVMPLPVGSARYPGLETFSPWGVACCAESDGFMRFLLKHMPDGLQEEVRVCWRAGNTWNDLLCFRGTPLALSAALGHTEQVRLLLDRGLDPDETGQGNLARFFVRRGFVEDGFLVTPVLAAILLGQEETARLLLDAGAVCDFSRPSQLRVLRQGSEETLRIAEVLTGVGFEKIPKAEREALRLAVTKDRQRRAFWAELELEAP